MASRPVPLSLLGRLFALNPLRSRARLLVMVVVAASLAAATMPVTVAAHDGHDGDDSRFVQTNLISNMPGVAQITDASLVNAWGMSFGPTTPVWVSNNGSDNTTLYRGGTTGVPFAKVPLTVTIPDGAPTGQVFAGGSAFMVGGAPAFFIFASEHGFIDAWQGGLSPITMAVQVAAVPGAEYKGLAISTGTGGSWLYAANFAAGKIDVFDSSWTLQNWKGAFKDSHIPSGYAPFNIQNLGGMLYVTYAKRGPTGDDVAGAGHGFVDVYSTTGKLVKQLVSRGRLDSPWGLQIAPAGFGTFRGDLLVGNFGDGRINAFNPATGAWLGTINDTNGNPLAVEGLWALAFGNGSAC